MQQEPDSTTNKDATLALIKQKYGIQRSDLWPAVEKAFLANSRKCAVCPSSLKPQVHHIYPFHLCHLVYRGDEDWKTRDHSQPGCQCAPGWEWSLPPGSAPPNSIYIHVADGGAADCAIKLNAQLRWLPVNGGREQVGQWNPRAG